MLQLTPGMLVYRAMLWIDVQQCGLPGLTLLCEAVLLKASYLVQGYVSAIRHPLTAIVVDVISDVLWLPRHSFSTAACIALLMGPHASTLLLDGWALPG